jgi:hydroxymethylpyrimidine pyrophosphatase-like HAD family hydrolase
VIVTGRPYVSADVIVQRLDLHDTPMVAFNGAIIRMPGYGETLYESLIPADLAEEVVEEVVTGLPVADFDAELGDAAGN